MREKIGAKVLSLLSCEKILTEKAHIICAKIKTLLFEVDDEDWDFLGVAEGHFWQPNLSPFYVSLIYRTTSLPLCISLSRREHLFFFNFRESIGI